MFKFNKSLDKKDYLALFCNVLIILFETLGIILSAQKHGFSLFQFYTEDSNLFAFLTSILFVSYMVISIQKGKLVIPKWVNFMRYVSTLCLTVTFIVVVCILSPMYGIQGYQMMLFYNSMLYHHLLAPIVSFISFVFFETKHTIPKSYVLLSLILTVIYAAVIVLLNILKVVQGPYPFLMVYNQPVYASILWCSGILGGAW